MIFEMNKGCERCGLPNLLGDERTRLTIDGVYVNEAGTRVYLEVLRRMKNKHGYSLGYISFPVSVVFKWMIGHGDGCQTWEEHLKEEREAVI